MKGSKLKLNKIQVDFFQKFLCSHRYRQDDDVIYQGHIPCASFLLVEGTIVLRQKNMWPMESEVECQKAQAKQKVWPLNLHQYSAPDSNLDSDLDSDPNNEMYPCPRHNRHIANVKNNETKFFLKGSGHLIGLRELFSQQKMPFSVRIKADSKVCILDKSSIWKLINLQKQEEKIKKSWIKESNEENRKLDLQPHLEGLPVEGLPENLSEFLDLRFILPSSLLA